MRKIRVFFWCLSLFFCAVSGIFAESGIDESTEYTEIKQMQVLNACWAIDPAVLGFKSTQFNKYQCFLLEAKFAEKSLNGGQIGDFLKKAGSTFQLVAQGKPEITARVFEAGFYRIKGKRAFAFTLVVPDDDFSRMAPDVPYLLTMNKKYQNPDTGWAIQKDIWMTKPGSDKIAASVSMERITFSADIDQQKYNLEAMIYRPNDKAKHPVIVMNHGRNGPHPSRNPGEVQGLNILNEELAGKGYVVMMLVRRGYGNSDGPDNELQSTAAESGLEAAKDIRSAVEFMRGQDYVFGDKVVIMGHSQGGWAALASSTIKIDGVIGVVNLCGGTNYRDMGTGNITPEVQQHWMMACGEIGKSALVPALWIYSENDRNHSPYYVKKMFAAFQKSGGKGKLVIKPPYGDNGHQIVQEPDLFINDILKFFDSLGFRSETAGGHHL